MTANRPLWGLLSRQDPLNSKASEVYGAFVARARAVPFYAEHGVADTPEGRIELIMLHLVLVLRRLGRDGDGAAPLARAVAETFVTDVDDNMREMGVGDVMVAKRVKKAAAGLYDRLRDYGVPLAQGDALALARLVERHVMMAAPEPDVPGAGAQAIAAYAIASEAVLAAAPADSLASASTPAEIPSSTPALSCCSPGT